MELLLNTFWLLIAAGALGILIRQWRRGARRRDLPLQLFALGCVLVFLLPVISASDDLHATALAVEASGFSRKILKSITPSGALVHPWRPVIPVVLLLALFSAAARKLVGAAIEQRVLLSVTGFIHPVDGRAPPTVLLLAQAILETNPLLDITTREAPMLSALEEELVNVVAIAMHRSPRHQVWMKRAVQAGRSLAFQAFRDKQARPQHTAGHESNISTSTGRMTNQRFVLKSKMMIRNFATTHQLTLEVDTKVLGRSGSRIGGRSGYVFELTEEPGTLYAVLKTTSSAEKWRTRIRLHLSGCKVKNFPKWAILDKYDAFSLLVGFDPDSAAQTRIVMAAAKLGRWDEYAA